MTADRRTAMTTGILFLLAIVAGVLSLAMLGTALERPLDLAKISESETQITLGALFELAMAVSVASIAITMYPVLKRQDGALALGYVGARLTEGILFLVSVIGLLSLLTLSQEFAASDAPDSPHFQTLGAVLQAAHEWAGSALVPTVAFGPSALIFYYLLYRTRLVPRWLALWGLIGAVPYIAAGLRIMFGADPVATSSIVLFLPIAINELTLGVWLIAKGFTPPATPTPPASAA
ncbi:MAG: DUF4386 domain-containing protein [Chloroflexi bacterium]|nr:DUF4386 domain-containing protein [Chloroflexota bacterium]